MKFIIPFNGDPTFIDWLLEKYGKSNKISHVYFPGNPLLLGSGRKPKIEYFIKQRRHRPPAFDENKFDSYVLELVKKLDQKNIAPLLLANGSVTPEVESKKCEIINYIERLCENGLKGLILGDERFLPLLEIRKRFPHLQLHASVFFGIKDVAEVKAYKHKGFDTVTIDPGINRSFKLLEAIKAARDTKITMLVNEGCLPFCKFRQEHRSVDNKYSVDNTIRDLAFGPNVESYKQMRCRKLFNEDPTGILRSPWIPPESTSFFEKVVDFAKLAGRTMKTNNLKMAVDAYLSNQYEGDLRYVIRTFLHMDVPINTNRIPKGFFEKVMDVEATGDLSSYFQEVMENVKEDWPDKKGPVFSKFVYDPDNYMPSKERSRRLYKKASQIIWKGGPEAKQHERLKDYGFPNFLSTANGPFIQDLDGNEYVDYLMAWGTVLLGHGFPAVVEAANRQMHTGVLFNLCHEDEVYLAQRLVELIPGAETIRFLISGSEATSAVVRIARAVTGRNKVIKYGFHGWLDWNQDEHLSGIPPAFVSDLMTLKYNDLDNLENMFKKNPGKIACIIMEPVKDEVPLEGFLEGVRKIAHENGALFIFDEIKTGFRFAIGGAQAYFNVIPDLAVFSKAISNGFPLAFLAGKKKVLDNAPGAWVNGTYHGWLPSIAAAHAVLDVLENEPVIERVWDLGKTLMEGFNQIMVAQKLQARLQGYPPMPRPRYPEAEKQIMGSFFSRMLEKGYYMHPNHAWFVSYAHDAKIIDKTLRDVKQAVEGLK